MANITGTTGNDELFGTSDSDTISALAGNDKITGGLGADTLYGNEGDDEFLLGSPDIVAGEVIDGGTGTNAISIFGAVNLAIFSFTNIQTLNIHHPSVTLSAEQFSSLSRIWAVSSAPSTLIAADTGTYNFSNRTVAGATFTFVGSAGNDSIIGNDVKQNIIGGLGADVLTGNNGADVFIYRSRLESTAVQTDLITDFFKGVDKIDLSGLSFRGVTSGTPTLGWLKFTYDSATHVTTLADLGGSGFAIKLNGNHLALDNTDFIGLGNIVDGTAGNDYLPGTSDIDKISGFDGNDVLQGLGGADTMLGGNGDDEFLLGFSEANGEVIDGGAGSNKISSWNADLTQATISNVQTLIANLDSVTLTASQFALFTNLFNYGSGAVSVLTSDAGSYSFAGKNITGAFNLVGSVGNDYLAGDSKGQTLDGGDGNDVLQGLAGADVLLGGNGDDDFLVGFTEANGEVIDGGTGNNKISSWNADLSQASISNVQTLITNLDRVTLTSTQFAGFSNILNFGGAPVVMLAATAGSYDLAAKNATGLFNVVGSTGDDLLGGNAASQTLTGGMGADTLTGGAGADVFVFRSRTESTITQADTITDFAPGSDKIDLTNLGFRGISTGTPELGELMVSYDAGLNRTTIADLSGSDFTIILQGDHSAIGTDQFIGLGNSITGTSGNDYLPGSGQKDIIFGNDGDDVLQGLGLNDTMFGGNGNDDFLLGFDEAIGDAIDGGAGNNKISSWNADLSNTSITNIQTLGLHLDRVILTAAQLSDLDQIITYEGHATVQAANPGAYVFADVYGNPNVNWSVFGNKLAGGTFDVLGSYGDDTLVANRFINVIDAGGGNDAIYADLGGDSRGTNTLLGGDGDDIIYLDRLRDGQYNGITIDGGSGINTLYAYEVFASDLSNLNLTNIQNLRTTSISITNQAQLEIFDKIISASNPSTNINLYAPGTYTLQGLNLEGAFSFSVSLAMLADFNITGDDVGQHIFSSMGNDTLDGRGGDDVLYGYSGNDTIYGGDGNDRIDAGVPQYNADGSITYFNNYLYGQNGDDFISAGFGNDYLEGGAGADTLNSAIGADTLIGGTGNDTYEVGLFLNSSDYTQSIIIENDTTTSQFDTLNIRGAASSQLWFTRSGDDLVIQSIGTTNTCTIDDWYLGDAHQVEIIKSSDNRTILDNQVQNLVNAMAAFAVPTTTTLPPDYRAVLDPIIAANWT